MLIGYQQGLVLKSLEYIVVQCNILLGDETCTCKRWEAAKASPSQPGFYFEDSQDPFYMGDD